MLKIENIKKSYQLHEVVKGVSLEIAQGEAFGLLGPNGAGKSTMISMICGLVPYDSGEIQVAGLSVKKQPMDVKRKIGLVPQDIALYPTMSAFDNLVFWGKMYGLKGQDAKSRAGEILKMMGLVDRGNEPIQTFSGGMKRRINIGAALMHGPELLIMDEPTVGIDPQSRNHILETVKTLNGAGMTIIYTSHYMEEVEYLCDRIAIIDHGEVIASGTTQELRVGLAGGTVLRMEVEQYTADFLKQVKLLNGVEQVTAESNKQLNILLKEDKETMTEIVHLSVEHNIKIREFKLEEANLESLFLKLTGRTLRD